ncbi:ATP-binding protein [Phenylobacterium sp.]|uniref:hybrid sensor histidine kinase/response regulator n=1 Tax=Phenylobacterium sp. TaxID=1871053 RepID=UPI0027347FDD|nr:ATP-binding protein [Phenylobacterium sp.]MDP3852578.1 ATP-binding protein [Phenylobacterium sp.]
MTASTAYSGPAAPGLRSRLIMLLLAVLIPAIATAGVLVWDGYRHQQLSLERQMSETARALSLVVDREIGQRKVLLDVLSTSPYLRFGDWAAFDAQARAATAGSDTTIVVMDAEGRQKVNTRAAAGAPLPATLNVTPSEPWRSGAGVQMRVSNLFTGSVSKAPVVAFSMPAEGPGGTQLTLNAGTPASSFDQVWVDQKFPTSWVGSIVDAQGVIVSRNRGGAVLVGKSASPGMIDHLRSAPSGVAETRTLDGVRSVTAWSRAPDYGWSFIVAVPKAEVAGVARRSLFWGGLMGLIILGAGAALATYVARSIAAPVEQLADAARAWEAGAPITPFPTGTQEIDALAGALGEAGQTVGVQRAELMELNASLEARVAARTRELAEATESLAQAQKMEAIGRLTGGVAHDFNNLLMAVLGNLDLLARRLTDPQHLRFVEQARAAGERGATLTAQLLAFSRRQRLEPRPMDIGAAVEAAAALLGPTLGANCQLQVDIASDLWTALGDATQVELMVVNLALNARDAMPNGGTVAVACRNAHVAARSDQGEAPAPGDYVAITVSDTGEGMTPEVVARAFEPFFTTKAVGKGSGLGLPQVLGLAKQLGGGVEIETAPGRGATLRAYLPRTSQAADTEAAADGEPDVALLHGLSVLLVDDDAEVRAVAAHMLSELGCRVVEADGGAQALTRLVADPDLQAALVDFAMPDQNGGQVADNLRRLRPGLPVVIMTGYADMDALAAAWNGPLLRKPFTLQNLAREMAAATRELRLKTKP